MLHREDPEGLILISQPAHAWISGQLARAWGNERFGAVEPAREVYAAAEQHDIGWLEWEASPRLNPETGRPYTFMNMPTWMHLSVWEPAGRLALAYGRYAALLVSMHGTGLYQAFHDYSRDTEDEARAARAFVANGETFQEELLDRLRDDGAYAPYIATEYLSRNRRLAATWDGLSLMLCGGITEERSFDNVPTAGDPVTLSIAPIDGDPSRIAVDPWPFAASSVEVFCEGRRLPDTFTDEEAMRAAFHRAPWAQVRLGLYPKS